METVAHAAVPDIAAHADAHSAEQILVHDKICRQVTAVLAFQVGDDLSARIRREFGRGLDGGSPLFHFETQQAFVCFKDLDVMARLFLDQRFHQRRDPPAIELSVGKARAKEFFRKLPGLFVDLHRRVSLIRLTLTPALSLRERELAKSSKPKDRAQRRASSFSPREKVRMRVPLSAGFIVKMRSGVT